MEQRRLLIVCLLIISQAGWCRPVGADDMPPDESPTLNPNAVLPTLGGKQFWTDELFFHDWHIQRSSFTGHCRLLSGTSLRYAWGTFDQCRQKLELIKAKRQLPPMDGPAVIVLHGLFRSSSAMSDLCRYLRKHGYTVFNFSYASTRAGIHEHAEALASVIENLEGIDEIYFVGHSLGNLVVRHYLADRDNPERGIQPDPRIRRMVMLGPPNRGARIAEALGKLGVFHVVAGTSGKQLAKGWDALEEKLATPDFDFGILAGGRDTKTGYNPLLGKDNDLVVSVESTRLGGAADFRVLPVMHSFMMDNERVQEYTLRFLEHGYFASHQERQPIPAE